MAIYYEVDSITTHEDVAEIYHEIAEVKGYECNLYLSKFIMLLRSIYFLLMSYNATHDETPSSPVSTVPSWLVMLKPLRPVLDKSLSLNVKLSLLTTITVPTTPS